MPQPEDLDLTQNSGLYHNDSVFWN